MTPPLALRWRRESEGVIRGTSRGDVFALAEGEQCRRGGDGPASRARRPARRALRRSRLLRLPRGQEVHQRLHFGGRERGAEGRHVMAAVADAPGELVPSEPVAYIRQLGAAPAAIPVEDVAGLAALADEQVRALASTALQVGG